jgi:ferrochelatase
MTTAVVVMAYGTPLSLDEVPAYYTHIRRGRTPTADQLSDLTARYAAIGGASPLRHITEAQVFRLGAALGEGWHVQLGLKHASPFIEDAVEAVAARGVERIVGVVLAPHYSRGSVGEYEERLRDAADHHALPVTMVGWWHDLKAWRSFQASAIRDSLVSLGAISGVRVLFTAHSLPEHVLEGDPYPDQLKASATAIADEAGIDRWGSWDIAWQSAGRTGAKWRGPDVLTVIDDLANTGRARAVLVCPQGFTADHLEVLYDLDIQAQQHAQGRGLAFARTRSVNDDRRVLESLAARISTITRMAEHTENRGGLAGLVGDAGPDGDDDGGDDDDGGAGGAGGPTGSGGPPQGGPSDEGPDPSGASGS